MILTVLAVLILLVAMFSPLVGALAFQSGWLVNSAAKAWPRVLWSFPTQLNKVVALTIDDAISGYTTRVILDLLKEFNATATFFVMGSTIGNQQELLHRIREQGCETGNHMWRDEPSHKLPPDQFDQQITMVDHLLFPNGVKGDAIKWYRPGSGWFNERILDTAERLGYRCVLGDIHPWDAQIRKPQLISWFVKQRVHDGGIIIMHDRPYTPGALREILEDLTEKGWRFVSLSDYCRLSGDLQKST